MNPGILEKLKKAETGPCISLIIPGEKTLPGRNAGPTEIKTTVNNIKNLLNLKYSGNGTMKLIENFEDTYKSVKPNNNNEGFGIYISGNTSEVVHFPFPVTEKIRVGEKFEIREILYMNEYLQEYYLLSITLDQVSLYKGSGSHLQEIKNQDFPAAFHDDYEYTRTSPGDSNGYSLKSSEKDKSIIKEIRFTQFLKETDKKLGSYLTKDTALVIAGVSRELGQFNKVTTHVSSIKGIVSGNYTRQPLELGRLAFEKISVYQQQRKNEQIAELGEAVGKQLAVTGLQNSWKAASEGRGLTLMVEKDYVHNGFVSHDHSEKLYLHQPQGKYEIVPDAVETIIEKVLEKNGRVILTENGQLENYDRIGLVLRYSHI